MVIDVYPGAVSGWVSAPPSKSEAHRILICAALAENETVVHIRELSDDIRSTAACLRALGAKITSIEEGLHVTPVCLNAVRTTLDCGESGSSLRFLLPVAAALGGADFVCSQSLARRPIKELTEALESRGAKISGSTTHFRVAGRLKSGEFRIPGNISSQYISGLLFALPLLDGDSEIIITTVLESAAYVDLTVNTLSSFGVKVRKTCRGFFVQGNQRYKSPGKMDIEGDWSNSAFLLAAGAIGGEVAVDGLKSDSLQGDRVVLRLFEEYGAIVEKQDAVRVKQAKLKAVNVDISDIPDLMPVLAVLSAFAQGESLFTGASRLALKESNRLSSCVGLINSLGGSATQERDRIVIRGTGLNYGTVDACSDHRIVMAAAVAACVCKDKVRIDGAQAVNKSYPSFFTELEKLGVKYNVI